jgi:ADP-ribosylglycohydrolase
MSFREAIRRSMLWAAYGDALGFITELASSAIVHRRVGDTKVTSLVPWKRRIGGRFGIEIELPAGCYSDDTQLRLATCRAIRGDGTFDVEVFGKIELPVWRAYSLGGGISTRAAAQALVKPSVRWCTNFYRSKQADYTKAGGNGAAMRIQPHVWAAPKERVSSLIVRDIVRNGITTHGHPRALIGAVFHGLCLLHTIRHGVIPTPADWRSIAEETESVLEIVLKDEDLSTFWYPTRERDSEEPLEAAFGQASRELANHIKLAEAVLQSATAAKGREQCYVDLVNSLGCFSQESRGSGTKTALLASFLPFAFEGNALVALQTCANLLGTDTDTIATMAGALLGAISNTDPPEPVADSDYLSTEAGRLASISEAQVASTFSYPDLLFWKSPEAEIDCVGKANGGWAVVGLGSVMPVGRSFEPRGGENARWEWFRFGFGQQVLLKYRANVTNVSAGALPVQPGDTDKIPSTSNMSSHEPAKHPTRDTTSRQQERRRSLSIEEATDAAIQAGLDPYVVGCHLLGLADSEHGIENVIAYAAIIAKARQARMKRNHSQSNS